MAPPPNQARDRLNLFLSRVLKGGQRVRCPVCHQHDFSFAGLVAPVQIEPETFAPTTVIQPVVNVVCDHCGCVLSFSWLRVVRLTS